jgi:uncharacterized protein YbjT (DUF2867 family)
MSILVVGATGMVGQRIALALHRQAGALSALVRGGASHPKAAPLVEAGVRIVDGDLTRPDTLARACAGVATVVCTATTMPTGAEDGLRRVDHDGVLALIDAAEAAGAGKFVYTSYSDNLRIDSPLERAKRDCEQRLFDSRMDVVVLRPSFFMEVWLGPHLGFDPLNATARIYGSGDKKVSYISAANVADFAVAAALRPTGKQAILETGGPEPLSQLDAVRVFERVLGSTFRLEFVPGDALRQQHQSPDPLQQTFGALMLGYEQGDVIAGAAALAAEYGVSLRSVSDYAASFRTRTAGV